MKFRSLRADETECRIARITEKGVQLLIYKDARCDMNILDETVGAENWQREHYDCKGNLFCRVGIKCGDEWVYKSDCGTESNTEAQKGESSDSFKRACFNWGVGRELYTSPFIWASADMCKISETGKTDKFGKKVFSCFDKFTVTVLEVSDCKITNLEIRNEKTGCTVFSMNKKPSNFDEIKCSDCNQLIFDAKKRNGEPWTATDIKSYSERRYKRCLCPDCMKKAEKANNG